MSPFLKIDAKDTASAVVSAVVVALLAFIGNSTDIFSLDWKQGVSVVVLTAVTSLLKSLATTKDGQFAGVIQTK